MSRIRALRRSGVSVRGIAAALGITEADVVAGADPLGGNLPQGGELGEVVTNTAPGEGDWAPGDERAVITEAYNVAVNADPFVIPLTNGWVPLGVEFGEGFDFDTEVYGSESGTCALLAENLFLVSICLTFSANLLATARLIVDTNEFNAFNSYNFPAGSQIVSGMFLGHPVGLGRVRPMLVGANGRTVTLTEARVVRLSRREHRPA